MRLEDKVAIVTGGASGLGEATVKLFAAEGARVVVADVLEQEGRAIEAEISETGGTGLYTHLDVTDESQWQSVVSETVSRFGKLDILVNNAGISGSDPDMTNTDAWDRLMDINAKGVFLGVKHAAPAMAEAGGGAIVNISSISGMVGQEYVHMGYSASKGAVRLLTKTAAVQHASDRVRVNSVHPGVMDPMRTSKITASSEIRDQMLATVPLGRVGTRLEIANAVLFLASDEASYITGAELMVDGGFTAN